MYSSKFHPGPPCQILLHPPYGPPAGRLLVTPYAYDYRCCWEMELVAIFLLGHSFNFAVFSFKLILHSHVRAEIEEKVRPCINCAVF
jgi:hypothetical protein